MANNYDNKKIIAKRMFITERRTAKEIAAILEIAQKTVGEWIKKYAWKEEREARAVSTEKRTENIEMIIAGMAEKRIRLERQIEEEEAKKEPDMVVIDTIRKEIAAIDYGVANWNKSLVNAQKEGKTTLTQYLQVMDDIFKCMRQYDYQLYLKTVDFQELHVHNVSNRK